jgi:DME family drug/metabolite transporter
VTGPAPAPSPATPAGVRGSILLVVLAGVLFGTAGTARALGPVSASPTAVGILRIQAGALALFAVMPLLGTSRRRLPVLWRRPQIVVTALAAAVYQPFFFLAVSRTGVALGTLLAVGAEPVFAGLLGWVALRHRPTRGWLAATAVAVTGLVMRSAGGLSGGDALGILLALGAGFASACWNVAAKHQLDRGATAPEVSAASFVLGGLLLTPLLLGQPLGWIASPDGAILVLYLGVATMAVANVLLARGIHGLAPGPAATLMLTDPVVATLLGVVVLGEALSPFAALGVALVLAGIGLQGLVVARASPDDLEPAPVL